VKKKLRRAPAGENKQGIIELLSGFEAAEGVQCYGRETTASVLL